jgi:hypothetical protein
MFRRTWTTWDFNDWTGHWDRDDWNMDIILKRTIRFLGIPIHSATLAVDHVPKYVQAQMGTLGAHDWWEKESACYAMKKQIESGEF